MGGPAGNRTGTRGVSGTSRERDELMTDETLACSTMRTVLHATTDLPDEPPTPREPPIRRTPDDDADDEDEVPSTPPTEPEPVPVQDPPAEPGRDVPHIV
jgi:hypothetical protein